MVTFGSLLDCRYPNIPALCNAHIPGFALAGGRLCFWFWYRQLIGRFTVSSRVSSFTRAPRGHGRRGFVSRSSPPQVRGRCAELRLVTGPAGMRPIPTTARQPGPMPLRMSEFRGRQCRLQPKAAAQRRPRCEVQTRQVPAQVSFLVVP